MTYEARCSNTQNVVMTKVKAFLITEKSLQFVLDTILTVSNFQVYLLIIFISFAVLQERYIS